MIKVKVEVTQSGSIGQHKNTATTSYPSVINNMKSKKRKKSWKDLISDEKKSVSEMARGPQKKLTKYKAMEIAKEILMHNLSVAYYRLENSEYNKYSDEEKELIYKMINTFGTKMAKSIGKEYYTL